ncbi:MAG: SgcJ/EcaC family oxidoreductase [Hymenobacter sp.]|nr:SgcJ/EcaC family oxidoreductase [Hymenobacter sp.]
MKPRLLGAALLRAGGPLTVQAQTVTTAAISADETAVRALVTSFNNAFNAHDVRAFGATFAADADFTNWRGMSAHGRASIEEFHVPVLTVIYKNGTQKVVDTSIRFIRPDVAAVDVRAEVVGGMTPDGKAAPLSKFLLNWTVTRESGGQWLIKVMHNNRLSDMPTPLLSPGSASRPEGSK